MSEPELRFKEDDGSSFPGWEEKSLSDLVDHYGGTALESYMTKDGKYKFISIGNYSSDGYYIDNGNRINAIGKAASKRLNKNDLVMVLNDKTLDGTILGATILIDDDNYIYNQRSERLVCKKHILPEYLWHSLNSPIFKRKVIYLKQGATQVYVNFKDVYRLKLSVPCIEEQQKIADLFFTLDNIIASVQKEVDSWELMKRGMMQKLFSQEVRFKADDGSEFPEWEEKRLLDILSQPITDGPHETPHLVDDGIPFISVDAIVDNKIDFDKKRGYISKGYNEQCNKKYKPQKHDVYLVKSGATVGKVAYVKDDREFNIWSPLAAMRVDNDNSYLFLYYLLQTERIQNEIQVKSFGGTQPNLSMGVLEKFTIYRPCLEEQQKIADCLSEFDLVIEKTKQKLEAYKQLKKGLMQRMFV